MKKFKRLITMTLAAVMAVSTVGIAAFAKETITYDNGITMTIYDEGEYDKAIPRTVDMTFSQKLTATLSYLRSLETSSYIMTLSSDETEIDVLFDNAPSTMLYNTMYDVTDDTYVIDDQGPYHYGKAVTYSGLTKGHKYKLGYRTTGATISVSGTVNSY